MVALLSISFAQDIKVSPPSPTFMVKSVTLKSVDRHTNDWRTGLGFSILNIRNGDKTDNSSIANLDLLVLTDAKDFKKLYLGSALDFPIFERKYLRVGVSLGWSADFSNFERIKNSNWGVGASVTLRF